GDRRREAAPRHGVLLPAEEPRHEAADRKGLVIRLDDLADGGAAHHLAEPDRRDVARAVLHPAAHRGVEREEEVLHEDLTVSRRRSGLVAELEVRGAYHAYRTFGEPPLAIATCGHLVLLLRG